MIPPTSNTQAPGPAHVPQPPAHAALATPSQDRGHLPTETPNPATAALDTLDTTHILHAINDLDIHVPRVVQKAIPAIAPLVTRITDGMAQSGRLIYVGAGTSGRLGVLDASECPPTFFTEPGQVIGIIAGGDRALRNPVEGAEDARDGAALALSQLGLGGADTLIGIAAGGTTPYVWGALETAKRAGCATGLILCVPLQDVPEDHTLVDFPIELLVGPEAVTGSTRMKAGTATKLVLNMITTAVMVRSGKTWGNLMVDLKASNAKLVDRACRLLEQQTGIDRTTALRLLEQTAGRVKPALVMARLGIAKAEAESLLAKHHGRLRPILGAPR